MTILSQRHPDVTAHELIAETAVGMAQAIYEEVMSSSNTAYRVSESRADFVKQCAPTLVPAARVMLASMLNDIGTTEWEKERIHEALILDNQLPKTGTSIVKKNTWH